jgi:hypothetical protein
MCREPTGDGQVPHLYVTPETLLTRTKGKTWRKESQEKLGMGGLRKEPMSHFLTGDLGQVTFL